MEGKKIREEYIREIAAVKKENDRLTLELEQANHLLERLRSLAKYRRSQSERARAHRLIQYGAAMETVFKELAVLNDQEIFVLVSKMLSVDGITDCIADAVKKHEAGEAAVGTIPFFSETG